MLMREGYERRMEIMKVQNIEGWRQARLTAYWVAKSAFDMKGISMTEWMPLEGDNDTNADKEREAQEVIEYYQQRGWLNQGVA